MEQQLCNEGCASYPPIIPLGGLDEVFHSQELLWIPKSCMEMDKPAMQAAPFSRMASLKNTNQLS